MQGMENVLAAVQRLYGAVLGAEDWGDSLSAILGPLRASRAFSYTRTCCTALLPSSPIDIISR